jgi:carbonic anhydrase
VNFDTLDTEPTGTLSYSYQIVKSSFEFDNNGQTFSADFAGLGYGGLTFEDNWYNLLNVNFHALSEHTFAGVHYPLEMHFIHKKWDSDDMVIVAVPVTQSNGTHHSVVHNPYVNTVGTHDHRNILTTPAHSDQHDKYASVYAEHGDHHNDVGMLQERAGRIDPDGLMAAKPEPYNVLPKYIPPNPKDDLFNTQLQHFLKAPLPIINAKSIAIVNELDPLDLNDFFKGGIFLNYAGSLTSPPCATNAIWFVRRNPILASIAQVKTMSDPIFEMTADFGNYRETMPMNGRPLATVFGIESQPPPQPKEAGVPIATMPSTDREFQAMKLAKDAFKMSKMTSDYVYSMDHRLQKAARAHADALAPDLGVEAATPAPRMQPQEINPVDMTKTAAVMAKAIAESAKSAIHVASEEIAKEATAAASVAAKEAAIAAGKEIVLPTAEPPPGAPGGAPGAAPGPGSGPAMPPAPAPVKAM